jgi:hypothetical protein
MVNRNVGQNLSTVVAGLPADGRTLYVRLHSFIGGGWQFNDYTLTAPPPAPVKAQLLSPAGGSTLTNSTVTFQWSGGVGATQYWLFVGSSPGTLDIASRDVGNQLSTVITDLPTDGRTIYVRLHSNMAGGWQFNDYTLTAATLATPQKAQLVTPAPGTTLSSSTVSFDWTGGVNATQYWLFIGSTPGTSDMVNWDLGQNLSTVVAGLPADGRTLYIRLHSKIAGAWQFNDYTLTAPPVAPAKAQLLSPAGGSTLASSTVTFKWSGGVGATQYWLFVGSSPGTLDIANRDMGNQLSTVMAGLPTNGQTIYVRLHSNIGGSWLFNDYTFTAASSTSQKAQLVTPAPGTTLGSSTVSFAWTGGVNATQYWLFIGSTPGTSDMVSRDMGQSLSTVVAGLPVDGRTLYVRLHSYIGGWQFNDYTFTAATLALQKANLVSPAAGSSLTSSTVAFHWTGGVGPTQYRLYVGTAQGAADIANLDLGNQLTAVVGGLPFGGQTIYVRLHSFINGAWQFNDYTLTAVGGLEEDEEEAMAINNAAEDTLVPAASDESPFDQWPVAVARREGASLAPGLR